MSGRHGRALVWVVASFTDHLALGVYGVELALDGSPAHGVDQLPPVAKREAGRPDVGGVVGGLQRLLVRLGRLRPGRPGLGGLVRLAKSVAVDLVEHR